MAGKNYTSLSGLSAYSGFFRSLLISFLVLCLGVGRAQAESSEPLSETAPSQPVIELDHELPELFVSTWSRVVDASERGDLGAVNEGIFSLDRLKVEAGFESLDGYSLVLLERSSLALKGGDVETSAFYLRKALQLSPNSPRILFQAASLASATGVESSGEMFARAFGSLFRHPEFILLTVKTAIYPMLLAFTVALYIVFVLTFCLHIKTLVAAVGSKLPAMSRGLVAPIVLLAALIAPSFWGLIWTLFAWGLIVLFLLPQRRWLSFWTAAVLLMWGSGIPIRENIDLWLADERVKSMFHVHSGIFSPSDHVQLEELVEQRPEDGVVWYTHGQLMRRLGDYDGAERSFITAERFLGKQPWTKAELGLLAFLKKNYSEARQLYSQAIALGLDNAEVYFNLSKVEFELLDTEKSREYLYLAREKNSHLVDALSEREERHGITSDRAVAETALPARVLLSSALQPVAGVGISQRKVAWQLAGLENAATFSFLGAGLLFLFFMVKGMTNVRGTSMYYPGFERSSLVEFSLKVLPGGPWIENGWSARAAVVLGVVLLLIMPLLGWPAEATVAAQFSPYAEYVYSITAAVIVLILMAVTHLVRGEK